MLVLATEIPVSPDRSVQDLLEVGRQWILGSPHAKFTRESFPAMPEDGNEIEAIQGGDVVILGLASRSGAEPIAGLRYVQSENDGLVWSTELVGAHDGHRFLVSLRVDCEAESWRSLPPPKKPVLIRMILDRLGGGADGDLEVTDQPLVLEPTEVDLAVRAMRGDLGNALPIVYVSAGARGTHLVTPAQAASDWSGLAHVLVEPNRAFSFRLRFEVRGRNAYAGAIGIYWPDGAGRRVLLPTERLATPELAVREVTEELRSALTNRRPSQNCTWDRLQELIAHAKVARLKEAGSKELDEYVKYAGEEIKAKKAELDRAEAEIRRLKAEVRRLEAIVDDEGSGGLLSAGVERDFFQGERLSIVHDALRDARTRLDANSRPAHVIDDLLAANERPDGPEEVRQRIRELFKDYRSMGARTRSELEDLGFEISEDGAHIKLIYLGDPRYAFIAPKTGSDHRGGRNLASEINRTLFSR